MPKQPANAIAYSFSLIIEDSRDSGLNEKAIADVLAELINLDVAVGDIAEVEHFLRRIMANNT